ncbi:23S rRNA (guanosine(2251)-2'-O)-methyltransferase RlmB [Desulfofalx alkaliphila]|uniref:23S rRNA (guanosine(2251)-2'-O)-methyltransferase RlmB n=1 Tax=Desulfofalx alkaliphila TaxID=105483 RepID=UPI0004E19217|nr:23S rRNA (guanosine(2251)-2'-O)-methyltransferase RlmB [Desulfofalx alkaliphila]
MSQDIIAGRNPVREALRAGRTLNKIMVLSGARTAPIREIMDMARSNRVPVQRVDKNHLDKITAGASHQGVVALAAAMNYVDLDHIIDGIKDSPPFLVLLDGIHDPHNLGAIIRTADAAGVHGVVIPQRRAVPLTSTVAKASAGAIEHLPVARVTNLAQTIKKLQDRGFWVVGADMDGQQTHWESPLNGPIALVIGGEGKGLGRLIKERCDLVVKLPMFGNINSLNASVAAALLIYEVVRQRTQGNSHA